MSELPGPVPPTRGITALDCPAPDLIEPVVGFRQWHLRDDRLFSPQRKVVWDDAVIHARCQSCVHDPDQIPAHDCSCGIYAYYEQVPRSVSARHNLVAGAVVLWGHGGASRRWDARLTRPDRRAHAAADTRPETTWPDRRGSVPRRAGRAVSEIESRRRRERGSSAKDSASTTDAAALGAGDGQSLRTSRYPGTGLNHEERRTDVRGSQQKRGRGCR